MDAAAKRYTGLGHRRRHHNLETAGLLEQYYRRIAPHLAEQAYREVILHIAYDRGLIQGIDVALMRLYTRATTGKKNLLSEKLNFNVNLLILPGFRLEPTLAMVAVAFLGLVLPAVILYQGRSGELAILKEEDEGVWQSFAAGIVQADHHPRPTGEEL